MAKHATFSCEVCGAQDFERFSQCANCGAPEGARPPTEEEDRERAEVEAAEAEAILAEVEAAEAEAAQRSYTDCGTCGAALSESEVAYCGLECPQCRGSIFPTSRVK